MENLRLVFLISSLVTALAQTGAIILLTWIYVLEPQSPYHEAGTPHFETTETGLTSLFVLQNWFKVQLLRQNC